MNFEGKTIWITGASSGIGAALAKAFSNTGAKLALSARNENKLNLVAAECNCECMVLPFDLAIHNNLSEKVERVIDKFGQIDILVNNGGISQRSTAAETALEITEKIFAANFLGTIAITKAVLPKMIKRKSGQIVVVSSVLGKFGAKTRSSYSASKHALHGYFDSLRAEQRGNGLTVTIICPGWIKTDISKNALEADGSIHAKMDEGQKDGIPPEVCAQKMLRIIKAKKEEALVAGFTETLAVLGKRWCPSLLSKILARIKMK